MPEAEIRCINKSDRYNAWERIRNVGGVNANGSRWKLSQEDAISHIERQGWTFYVRSGGHRVDCIVAISAAGNKYIKTKADGETPNNLLALQLHSSLRSESMRYHD